jgi:tetraacyldisaccharide 4'-kinase
VTLATVWASRGLAARVLWPIAQAYAGLAALHRRLFRLGLMPRERLPVPVLVVGNVVAGGAGKTPVVRALVDHLAAQGLRVGIISRGYGGQGRGVRAVHPDSDPREVGDEPVLLARLTGVPVVVAAQRAEAGRALLTAHPQVQVLVSDDGLQHWALHRDLEIGVFDDRGLGNGWPLPAGPLRESWPRPLDLVLAPPQVRLPGLTAPRFTIRRHLSPEAVQADGTRRPLADLRDAACLAVAGIARPHAFFALLAAAGVRPASTQALPDHHDFSRGPALQAHPVIICTEKDAVKLWRLRPDAWAVPLVLDIEPGFWAAINAWLDAHLPVAAGAAPLSSDHGSETA